MNQETQGARARRIFEEVGRLPQSPLEKAFAASARLHEGQIRKGSEIPYLSHLVAVAGLVQEAGGDEEMVIAALLHDSVEDQGADYEDLERVFGRRVSEIVRGCTDVGAADASDEERSPESSMRRKRQYLEHLENEDRRDVLRVSLADKLHNARAILSDYQRLGDKLWDRFNVGKEDQLWYYKKLAKIFLSKFPGDSQARELAGTVSALAAKAAISSAPSAPREDQLGDRLGNDYADFIRISHLVLGIGFCFTIILAPLGIWLIREGKRKAERIRAEVARSRAAQSDLETALAIGIASSWDDLSDVHE